MSYDKNMIDFAIVVDYQNDFVQEDGALSVPNAKTALPTILEYYNTSKELLFTHGMNIFLQT